MSRGEERNARIRQSSRNEEPDLDRIEVCEDEEPGEPVHEVSAERASTRNRHVRRIPSAYKINLEPEIPSVYKARPEREIPSIYKRNPRAIPSVYKVNAEDDVDARPSLRQLPSIYRGRLARIAQSQTEATLSRLSSEVAEAFSEGTLGAMASEVINNLKKKGMPGPQSVEVPKAKTVNEANVEDAIKHIMLQSAYMGDRREMRDKLLGTDGYLREIHERNVRRWTFSKFRARAMGMLSFTLWGSSLQKIESRYGNAVVAFFKLMKWSMMLNLVTIVFILGLILVPQALEESFLEDHPEDAPLNDTLANDCNYTDNYWVSFDTAYECCSFKYANQTPELDFDSTELTESIATLIESLLLGTDWMEDTFLFYGHYYGTFVFYLGNLRFDFPLAYFLVMMSVLVVTLVAIVVSSAKSFKVVGLPALDEDLATCKYNNLVFGTYNHGMFKFKGAQIQRYDIRNQLKILVHASALRQQKVTMTREEKIKLIAIRVFANIAVLGLLAGTAILIFYLTAGLLPDIISDPSKDCYFVEDVFSFVGMQCFLLQYVPSFAITVLNLILPLFFNYIVAYERYSTNVELIITLTRCFFVRLASLVFVFFTIFATVSCDYATGCQDPDNPDIIGIFTANEKDPKICSPDEEAVIACSNHVLQNMGHVFNGASYAYGYCGKTLCWETYMGQQFYRLAIMDFIVQFVLIFFVDLPRVKIFGRFKSCGLVGNIQFNVTKHALDVVYAQTINWLAIFYSPLIVVVTFIKSFFIIYFRIFYVLYVCTPSSMPYSATRASSMFKIFLLLSFCCCLGAVGYTVSTVQPSLSCGPYRNIDCNLWIQDNEPLEPCLVYDYVIGLIMASDKTVSETFILLGKSTVLFPVAFLILMVLYFVGASARSQKKLAEELKSELVNLSREKAILLADLKARFGCDDP